MARLTDLHSAAQERLRALDCPTPESAPWVTGSPLSRRKVAMISSAALIRRGDRPFLANDVGWRRIAHDTPPRDLLMSHVSVNFDRTGFMMDDEVVLPRRRLDELVATGDVGSVASTHYSFMGSNDPKVLGTTADQIAGELRADRVDAAILVPV